MFAYCGNNPVNSSDYNGEFWDTVLDVVSVGFSIAEVAVNPTDPWAWAGLAGDLIDLIPFVTGIGETTRAIKVTVSAAEGAGDVISAARKSYNTLKQYDQAADFVKATGSYEIIYKSGKNYVGKGGFERAIKSAKSHADDWADTVESITWRSAPNKKCAFIDEYARQLAGTKTLSFDPNAATYNKIWSPGKGIVDGIRSLQQLG